MRTVLITLLSTSLMATSAFAAPSDKDASTMNLPSKAEMEAIIEKMPNINGMMDRMVELNKDGKIQNRMERSGKALTKKLEQSGALEARENGLPDFNKLMAVMLMSLSDEDIMGGLVETAQDMMVVMEDVVDDSELRVDED